jgi:hypothetical protein
MYLIHPRKKGLPTYIHEDFDAIVAMLTAYGARRGYQLPEPPAHDNGLTDYAAACYDIAPSRLIVITPSTPQLAELYGKSRYFDTLTREVQTTTAERDALIRELAAAGTPNTHLAELTGISRERVRQIISAAS